MTHIPPIAISSFSFVTISQRYAQSYKTPNFSSTKEGCKGTLTGLDEFEVADVYLDAGETEDVHVDAKAGVFLAAYLTDVAFETHEMAAGDTDFLPYFNLEGIGVHIDGVGVAEHVHELLHLMVGDDGITVGAGIADETFDEQDFLDSGAGLGIGGCTDKDAGADDYALYFLALSAYLTNNGLHGQKALDAELVEVFADVFLAVGLHHGDVPVLIIGYGSAVVRYNSGRSRSKIRSIVAFIA